MATMETCNLCGGHGFIAYYHPLGQDLEEDRDTRRCPNCHGLGSLESWRQPDIGLHHQKAWVGCIPPYREESIAIQALIRQRSETW